MWFPLLSLLFIGLTVTELYLLITIGGAIGAPATIGIIILTGVVGAWLARREGLRTMREFQRLAGQGVLPSKPLFDGVAILVGAALLMTPGVVTDALGFSLLLPPSRALFRAAAGAWLKRKILNAEVTMKANLRVDATWTQPASDKVYDQTFDPPTPTPAEQNAEAEPTEAKLLEDDKPKA